jgi:hypothetical protein
MWRKGKENLRLIPDFNNGMIDEIFTVIQLVNEYEW